MPYKERYWKNPAHHRKEARDRARALTALGYKGGRRKISSYLKSLERTKLWQKNNVEAKRKITKRHLDKVRSITGIGNSELAVFRLKLMGGMYGYKKSNSSKQA